MAKLDWNKAKRYSRDKATSVQGKPSANRFPSKYAGVCGTCGKKYLAGTFIKKDKFTGRYIHSTCPTTPVNEFGEKIVG